MAVYEIQAVMSYKDKDGNLYLLYPVTKLDCVDDMEELNQHLQNKNNPHEVTAAQVMRSNNKTSAEDSMAALETFVQNLENGELVCAALDADGNAYEANDGTALQTVRKIRFL